MSAPFQKFQVRVSGAKAKFESGETPWLGFFHEKEDAYSELLEADDSFRIANFWRVIQSCNPAAWLPLILAEIAREARNRKCADCETPLVAGVRCEKCAEAKREKDKVTRKLGRKTKRRVNQLMKKGKP